MSGEKSDGSLIKTPRQLITALVLGFLVPVLGSVLLAYFVVTASKTISTDQSSLDASAIEARIKPVASVFVEKAGGSAVRAVRTGEQIVKQFCGACHATGAAGAPKIGDKAAWAKHLGGGLDQMLKNAIAGRGAMPARGGVADLSDNELASAIVYMANLSGGELKEPAVPQGAAPGTERTGEQVVLAACSRCHESGLNGAPRIGDTAAWSPRVSQGIDAVTRSAIRGHGGMPARGGLADLTDREVTSAILYMFGRAGAPQGASSAGGDAKPASR